MGTATGQFFFLFDGANQNLEALWVTVPTTDIFGTYPAGTYRLSITPLNNNAKSPKGEAALHMAATAGKLEVVRALAEGGADLRIKDAKGKTALQLVEAQKPRKEGPTAGALVTNEKPAQPAEVAALLRELMNGNAQANASEVGAR